MPEPSVLLLVRNPANRRLLGELLEGEGLTVVESEDLEEAHKRAGADSDLAMGLVDLGGQTEDVWELCKELGDRDVPVVVLTNSRTDAVQEGSLRAGVHSVIEKPVRKANLTAMVDSLVDAG